MTSYDHDEFLSATVVEQCREMGKRFLDSYTVVAQYSKMHTTAAGPLIVNTMTLCGKFFDKATSAPAVVPIRAIEQYVIQNPDEELGVTMQISDRLQKRSKTDSKTTRDFATHLPLRYQGKSIKLFANGSVHVTGCTTPMDFLMTASQVGAFVAAITCGECTLELATMHLSLINATTNTVDPASGAPLGYAPRVVSAVAQTRNVHVDFDPERHPAAFVHVDVSDGKTSKVAIFSTGSVSFLGFRRPEDIAIAFRTVMTLLDAASKGTKRVDRRVTTARTPLTLVDGYPMNSLLMCSS